jgi:hypothetical protein
MIALVKVADGSTYVASQIAHRGSWIDFVGCWRGRYGPRHSPYFVYGPRRRYAFPARRVELVRWDLEPTTADAGAVTA